jgi:putative hydrolase of the HAD superfamily
VRERVRAIFFDLGGTLFRYGDLREPFNQLLLEQLTPHGCHATPEDARARYGEAMAASFRELGRLRYYRHADLFCEGHRRFLADFGIAAPAGSGERFYRAQIGLGLERVQARPDAEESLAALAAAGIHLGIVSNIDDDQFEPLWARMGLADYVDATTTSDEARSCKPDAAIFRAALAKAGDPAPGHCLFVGDSPYHDVAGARAVGMRSVLITSRPERVSELAPEERPDHAVRTLKSVAEIALR